MRFKKMIILLLSVFVFLLAGVFIEQQIRRWQVAELFIEGLPIEGVEVAGHHMPDFLGAGRAWWIEFNTTKPLALTLDEWSGRIPVGKHKVYSNHDETNTKQFSNTAFWGFPKVVKVREATQ